MFLYKYKKKCLPLLKTAVFQDYICSRTIRLGPNSSAQKSKRSHPGTQILSQIPEDGEGNTPYSKMAAASDDLGRVARERGIEGHDSMFTRLHVVA